MDKYNLYVSFNLYKFNDLKEIKPKNQREKYNVTHNKIQKGLLV